MFELSILVTAVCLVVLQLGKIERAIRESRPNVSLSAEGPLTIKESTMSKHCNHADGQKCSPVVLVGGGQLEMSGRFAGTTVTSTDQS